MHKCATMRSGFLEIITTLLVALSVGTLGAQTDDNAIESDDLFSLLREGDRSIKFDDNYKDLIILIGNPGAGKTTIGLILTANQSSLEAYEDEGADKILIRDNGGLISSDLAKSKTIFPELMINPENGAAFYDCAGFRDTRKRNASIDVANTIFIKKIADHARTIKVVMIVNFESVRKGAGRNDFLNLLQSTLKLLKPIEKFVNSTALIATKVSTVRTPERTVQTIANYLNIFKESLPEVLPTEEYVQRAEILLNALSLKINGSYPRIYFTRVPSEVGLLSNIPEMQSDRLNIGKVIYENLDYAPVSANDFGYTFSTEAQALLAQMLHRLELNAAEQVDFLCDAHHWYFQDLVSQSPDTRKFIAPVSDAKLHLRESLEEAVIRPNVSASSFVEILMNLVPNGTVDMGSQTPEMILAFGNDKKVFDLLKHVADLKMESHLLLSSRIQRLIDVLQVIQDWLLLLDEIDDKLNNLSQPTTTSQLNGTKGVSRKQYVDQSSWFVILKRIAAHLRLQIPFAQVHIARAVKESTAIFHLNQIVGRIIETRWENVGLTLRKLSSDLKHHFISDESPNSRQQLRRLEPIFAEKVDNCTSNGLIAPVEIINLLNGSIATTFYEPLPAVRSAMDALQYDQRVFSLFRDVPDKPTQRDACTVYQNTEEFKNFSNSSLSWYEHVDQLASKVPIHISTHDPNVTLFVSSRNSLNILTQLSKQFKLKMPTNPDIPRNFKPLQRHLNQMLIEICTLSSRKISEAMDDVTQAVVNNLRSRISNLKSLHSFVTELLQLKLNFDTLREDAVTCLGERNLEKFLNEQFQAGIKRQTGCELLELVRSNIPRFCRQDSMAKLSSLLAVDSLFENTLAWYEFLIALATKLDTYPMQRDKSLYNVANVTHWGQEGMPQGIYVTIYNCQQFLERASRTIGTTLGRRAESICAAVSQLTSPSIETTPLDHLNDVLTLTLKTIGRCNFTAGVATVKGSYVKLSEALQCIQPGATQRLVILATHGFFIDTKVIAVESNGGKAFDLIVISPDWTSAATSISLDGYNSPECPSTLMLGMPGKPGGNGGNFFGLARNVSGLSFTVSTNGGNGGAGQNGEAGRVGYDGTFCGETCIRSLKHNGYCSKHSHGRVILDSKYGHREIEDGSSTVQYALEGTRAAAGGRGGDGGKGGIGGNPGFNFLEVFCNGGHRLYKKSSNGGASGQDGVGGVGGLGGMQNELRLVVDIHRDESDRWFLGLLGSRHYTCWITSTVAGTVESRASSGERGVTGRNVIGLQHPAVNNFNATEILHKFTAAFISESSRHLDLFKKDQLHAFRKQLENFQIAGSNNASMFC